MFPLEPALTISFFVTKAYRGSPLSIKPVSRLSLFLIFGIFFFYSPVQAQPCNIQIANNSIEIKPATCINTVATLLGTNPGGGNGTYTYQWEKSVGNCGLANFQPIAGATAKDYAVPATADPDDCFRRVVNSGTCGSNSNTTKVQQQDRTTPAPPITTAVSSGCVTGTGVITVTNPAPGAGIFYSINGTTYTNTTGVFINLNPGTYSVTARYPAGCISPAKSETVSSLTTVTGTITPSTAVICTGGNRVLTVNGGTSYQWYRNGVLISGATGNTYSATIAGVYTADIIVGLCRGSSSNSATVTVSQLPSGSISPANAAICAGGSVALTATGGDTYQWFRNGVIINGATVDTYTATQPGTYAADIINDAGCKVRASNESIVTITPLPTGSITPASGVLCNNGSITLTASGGTSYQWYKNATPIAGATSSTYSVTTAGSYTAEIKSGNCSNMATNTVVITGAASAGAITPSTASICQGGSRVLSATGGGTYQWYRDGNILTGSTQANYTATQPGTYSVVITNGSCSTAAANVALITLAVSPSGIITPASGALCPGGKVTLTAIGAGGGYTYQWFYNGALVPGATSAIYNAEQNGTYNMLFSNGTCNGGALNIVTVSPSVAINFNPNATNPNCTSPTGSITVTGVNGGGANSYLYSKDNGSTFQTSNTFTGLSAGNYQVVVKDTAGCVSAPRAVAVQPFTSTLSAAATPVGAKCSQPGSVTIQPTGGTPGYTYSLDNGAYQPSNSFSNLTVGNHKVSVKDAPGCVSDVAFVILQTGINPNLVVTAPPKICPGFTANLQSPGTTAGSDAGLVYTYWTNAAATTILATPGAVAAGTYYIKATNTEGCFTIKPVVVAANNTTPGTLTPASPPLTCFGSLVLLTASSGSTYQWFRNDTVINGAVAGTYSVLTSGVYSVSISDGTCSVPGVNKVTVQFEDCETKVFVPTGFTPNKNGQNDVLRPILYNVAELRYFKIYNRWGQEVYQTNKPGNGWDGTIKGAMQPAESYSWILECVGKNGETKKQSGRSLLIR